MQDELIPRVLQVIAKTQHIKAEALHIDQTFAELKFDSLDAINIVFAIENEFNVNIPDDAMQNIRSIRDVVDGVEKLLAAQNPS